MEKRADVWYGAMLCFYEYPQVVNNLTLALSPCGGARVITFTIVVAVDETEINLLYLYDKSERSSITPAEIEDLLKACGLL